MTGLVLLHGWGYGPETWDGLANAFGNAPVVILDAGYFSPSKLTIPDNPDGWLGVGHSLGFARLLQMDIPWRGLVGIGGFLRFCQKPGKTTGTPPAMLDAMLARLNSAPEEVLARFHKRCDHRVSPLPTPGAEGLALLRADLSHLRDLDQPAPARPMPTLFIQAQDDRIVPPDLPREAQSLFSAALAGSRLIELDTGGHALPMTRAQDCQRLIQEFLHDLG
ncbi:MAG: alpha/beta hydrolase [Proteobacteria bacterium]|nr:alpha/beta hydrolase [Pseudomonadota bacterium]